MEKPQSRKVNPATSEELTGVKVAMEHAIGEMGAVRAFQTLAKLNQKNGCAWPDPAFTCPIMHELAISPNYPAVALNLRFARSPNTP